MARSILRFRPVLILSAVLGMALAGPALAQRDPAPALYLVPEASTAGAGIAVSADGTMHMVATSYNASAADTVTYATCRANCTEDGSWSRVVLPVADALRAEIAVTSTGQPRLLITTAADTYANSRDYIYAECGAAPVGGATGAGASACLTPAGWSMGRVAASQDSLASFLDVNLPQRTFTLDARGNPRFIYVDSNYFVEPDHYGAFYMSCEGACTLAYNWTETDIAGHVGARTESFVRPVLAMGPNGSAHVLSWIYSINANGSDGAWDVFYLACASGCTNKANWSRVSVLNPGTGSYPSPTWDLAVTADGRPRAAIFTGGGTTLEGIDHSLIYLWCDTGCTTDDGWNGTLIYGGSMGESPAIALDAAGHPRIAFLSSDALPVLAACDVACETPNDGVWNGFIFEAEEHMAADRPTAMPFTCDGELWNALAPDLAIAPNGQAFVAYDVSVQARCLYREFQDPQITYEFHEIWRGARMAEVPAP